MEEPTGQERLKKQFSRGKPAKIMAGFYRGELTLLIPQTVGEKVGGFLAEFYLPWLGKVFYAKEKSGDNILKPLVKPLIAARFGEKAVGSDEFGGFHAFPFKTSVEKGIEDAISVLRLDYNLPQNPEKVRAVVDEVVEVGKNSYLGKAYLKERRLFRLVAFFRLKKRL